MIDSPIHHRGGPVFFVLSLIPLFLLVVWLRRHEPGAIGGAVLSSGESKQESAKCSLIVSCGRLWGLEPGASNPADREM